MIGTTLLHYRIESKIGEGGMGVVYKATDSRLGRTVAIKALSPSVVGDTNRLRRFTQEARAASSLNHPNIVTIYDIASAENIECLVMEFVAGRTLSEVIPPTGLPAAEALAYGAQIAAALAAAHAAGIMHRDLKPANVMVSDNGLVKVLDFGLAKRIGLAAGDDSESAVPGGPGGPVASTQSVPGALVGTAAYMSPEQAQGQPLDTRSDIFSFGAVLYEMLTGQRAFSGDSLASTLSAVLRDDPRPVQEIGPHLSSEVADIVSRCLRKDRMDRFQSMKEIVDLLRSSDHATPAKTGASVAVLPLANMSADQENEFLADGITEDLIMALSRVKGLRVPARTSSFAFKGKNEDIRRIGQLLNVDTVLEGSVRKSGNKLRITAQLVNVRDGFHLWAERYDREMKEVFDIQDDITRAIVDSLQVQLGTRPDVPLVKGPTESAEAYQLYLKGREFLQQRGRGVKKSLHYFELSLLEDPNYALAHVGVADAYCLLGFYDELPFREAFVKAAASAERARELDDQSAEAHASLGWLKQMRDWDPAGAEREYLRALDLNANCAAARVWYATSLFVLGRTEEALAQARQAVEIEPMAPIYRVQLAWRYLSVGRCEAAIPVLRTCLEGTPHSALGRWLLGWAHLGLGRVETALGELEKAVELSGRWLMVMPMYARALAATGQRSRAEDVLRELQARTCPAPTRSFYLAEVHAALGDRRQALTCLEQAFVERDFVLPWLRYGWMFSDLHGDAQFEELARRVEDEIAAINRA
jgi:serine/threonine protein kinase/tetratricopeptide (TPR) repeat protein